ncbi:MAG: hypothetical protein KGO81_06820 [Bacteroidota bacterium]|nr:hypothetical protein [Bacteroidota bacterium]
MKKPISFLVVIFIAAAAYAQVGIGTTTPDASAKLDVNSTNKGFLPPRVALTATNAAGPITSPATGLLVYNTATAGTTPNNVVPGYYYNSGSPAQPSWSHLATVSVENTYKLASIGTALINNTSQTITTYQNYVAINNSAITVTVPAGYTNTQVFLQWNVWGDVNVSTTAMGSLRFQISQTGVSTATYSSVMMTGWSTSYNGASDTRYSAPVSYIISGLTPGTYTFSLSMQREGEIGTIASLNFWGLAGTGQVFVQ